MSYDEDALALYRAFVLERHRIWTRRHVGEPGPWTEDSVLSRRKFTNMFRVLDPGSQFVFELKDPDPACTIARLVLYRITNLPSTWRAMRDILGHYPTKHDIVERDNLTRSLHMYRDAGNKVFSGAYIIVPEPGTTGDKVSGAVRVAQHFALLGLDRFLECDTQEERFEVLRSTPGLGKFLSMQILADWSYLQDEEPDPSFVVAGPGARRGAAILNSDLSAEDVIYDLTIQWSCETKTPVWGGRTLSPMDVQNTLCELGKYVRERTTPIKKSPYKPASSGPFPEPVLPAWW